MRKLAVQEIAKNKKCASIFIKMTRCQVNISWRLTAQNANPMTISLIVTLIQKVIMPKTLNLCIYYI